MNEPKSNSELISKFLNRLLAQTKDGEIEWESHGGVITVLKEQYTALGLITEEDDDASVYHPDHLNTNIRWVLDKDIVACNDIEKGKSLVIIPYKWDGQEDTKYFDFLFVWSTGDKTMPGSLKYHWEKAFYTADDPFTNLEAQAAALYNEIEDQAFDTKLTPSVRSLIKNYLQ